MYASGILNVLFYLYLNVLTCWGDPCFSFCAVHNSKA